MGWTSLLILSCLSLGSLIPWAVAEKKVVCYMVAWAVTRPNEGKFSVSDADTKHCTHVIYAFMGLDEDTFEMKSIDTYIDGPRGHNQLGKLKQLKEANPQLKVLVSIGGYNERGRKFSVLAGNQQYRQTFIAGVLKFLRKYNLDGIDICWQFPGDRGGRPSDKVNSLTLFREIKEAFQHNGYLLTVHVLGKKYIIDLYDIKGVSEIVDFINMPAVEFSGPWERTTGVMAPLVAQNENSVTFVVNYILSKEVPREKVNLGIPLYGHAYVLEEVPKEDNLIGLFSNKTFSGPWTQEGGIIGFYESCQKLKDPAWKQVWHEPSKTPLAFNEKLFMSYDNERSLLLKANLVDTKGLGGIMFWAIDMDDFRGLCFDKKFPIVSVVSDYVNKRKADGSPDTEQSVAKREAARERRHASRHIRSADGKPTKVVVCYIAAWSGSRPDEGKFSVADADVQHCTHIIYAFHTVDESTNKVKSFDAQDARELPKLRQLKMVNPSLKVMVSVGGWLQGSKRFSSMAESREKRAVFVESVLQLIRDHDLDGVDICWQFPTQRGGKPEDKQNSLQLFKDLKKAFEPQGYILTVHVRGQKHVIDSYDIKAVSEVVDFINFATVEYHGPWENTVQPTTPLTSADEANVKFSVDYILKKGVSPGKVLLGLATYGHAYSLAEPPRGKYLGIYYDHGVSSLWTNEPGLIGYNELCYEMENENGWEEQFEEYSQTPLAYFDRELVTYDNVKSHRLKTNLVDSKKLAGVMIWSLDMDDFRGLCHGMKYPLVSNITYNINRRLRILEGRKPGTSRPSPQAPQDTGPSVVSHEFGRK